MPPVCINPKCCDDRFIFGPGSLFAISTTRPHRQKTRFAWMCASCSQNLTATMDDAGRIVVFPRLKQSHETGPYSEKRMKLLFCARAVALPVALSVPA